MVPMTFISFIDARPPAARGSAVMFRCTTVSTAAVAITLAISGLRMSARTNSVRPEGQLARRRDGVDADDPLDRRVVGQQRREPAAEVAADPGDEDHGRWHSRLPSRPRAEIVPPETRVDRAARLAGRAVDDGDLGRGLAQVAVHPAEHHRLAASRPAACGRRGRR